MSEISSTDHEMKQTEMFIFAFAIQLITPIPFLPGLPLPRIGLIVLFILLFRRIAQVKTLSSLGRTLLVFFALLLAGIHDDVLLRLALCLICFLIVRIDSSKLFAWYFFWFLYQLVFTLITPFQFVVQWIAAVFCYATWIIGFGWIEPRVQFSFGPDIAQVHFFILWFLFLLAAADSISQIKFKNLLPILLSILIISAELNYLNAAFSDFNIQLISLINFILFPVIFLYFHKRQNILPV